jgi:hypothetical protein
MNNVIKLLKTDIRLQNSIQKVLKKGTVFVTYKGLELIDNETIEIRMTGVNIKVKPFSTSKEELFNKTYLYFDLVFPTREEGFGKFPQLPKELLNDLKENNLCK